MRRFALAALAFALALPAATAAASPVTVGASLGYTEAKSDATATGSSGNSTPSLAAVYARLRVSRFASLQAEVGKQDESDDYSSIAIRTVNAVAVIDLAHGSLVPIALAGVGLDVASAQGYDQTTHYLHAEIGAGLEYRFRGGFVVGADVRVGTRDATDAPQVYEAVPGYGGGALKLYSPGGLAEGEYRSARLTVGVHF